MEPLLAVEHISKTYGDSRVLQDVAFDLYQGEVHALVGENGAGKSTLIKIIAGVEQPDPGSVLYFEGRRAAKLTPQKAIQKGVAVIYQDISLFPNLTVAENIAMDYGSRGFMHWTKLRSQAARVLAEMGCGDWDVEQELGALSLGRQQLVALARAIYCQARIVVMDEPTSALSQNEVQILFQAVERLRQQAGVIYISHKLDEVFQVADRVTVLRDGQKIATRPVDQFQEETLIQMMVGRELGLTPFHSQQPPGEALFTVEGLSKKGLFTDVSFTLHKGEILGLTGLVGAKRTEVALALFGMLQPDRGQVTLAGRPLQIKSPADAIANGLCYLPEDRRTQGLFLQKDVAENISAAHLQGAKGRFGLLDRGREAAAAQQAIQQLHIKPADPWILTEKMSGGNQQKVLFSRWLQAQPQVLLVDEPTSGVDIGAKQEIHRLLRQLAAQGVGVLVISSDLPEVLAVADRILVMRQGKIVAAFPSGGVTQEEIMAKSLNG